MPVKNFNRVHNFTFFYGTKFYHKPATGKSLLVMTNNTRLSETAAHYCPATAALTLHNLLPALNAYPGNATQIA